MPQLNDPWFIGFFALLITSLVWQYRTRFLLKRRLRQRKYRIEDLKDENDRLRHKEREARKESTATAKLLEELRREFDASHRKIQEVKSRFEVVERQRDGYLSIIQEVQQERDTWRGMYYSQGTGHDNAQRWMMREIESLSLQVQALGGKPKISSTLPTVRAEFEREHGEQLEQFRSGEATLAHEATTSKETERVAALTAPK